MVYLRDEVALIELIGVNGEVFTLTGDNEGDQGVILNKGPQGLMEAPRKTIWGQGATQDGATYQGVTVDPLDLVLGFQVWGDDQDWHFRSAALRKAFDYDREATIRVTTDSGQRWIKVRLLEAPQRDTEIDGRWRQYSLEIYTLRAAWPFWESEFDFETKKVMGNRLKEVDTSVSISNPTDTKLWLQWSFSAPGRWRFPDYDFVEDFSKTIETPTLYEGQSLTVDTYPLSRPYVSEDDSNIAGRFGGVMPLNYVPPHTPERSCRVYYKANLLTFDDEQLEGEVTVLMRRFWNSPWGGE